MPMLMPMHSRSSTLIRKRLVQAILYLLRQIRRSIMHMCAISFSLQLLQFPGQRIPFFAAAIDVDKEHDGEGEAD
jgi:hypothetical protein